MAFEEIIKKISAFIASFVVFFLAAGMYLSFKGFVMQENGQIVLVNHAVAKEPVERDFKNMRFPENYVLGDEKAPVTIYEYSSLSCTHCADFHLDVLPKIKADYIDKGKVKLIFADLPLDKKAMQASLLARCFEKDKYYDFLAVVFKKQSKWLLAPMNRTQKYLVEYAGLNGMSAEKAEACMKDERMVEEIADIRQEGIKKLKITGTPSFVVVSGDKYEFIEGILKYQGYQEIFDKMLQK